MSVPFISWCLVIVIAVIALIIRFIERLSHAGTGPHGLRLEHRKVAVEADRTAGRHTEKS